MPKISVIVPVYNGKKYIKENAENILSQTFKDFELIYVDDGSTDSSIDIIKSIAAKDGRVKYIYEENAGASTARLTGVKNAKSEFIAFIDIDDSIKEDYLETLYSHVSEYTDMVCCNSNEIKPLKDREIIQKYTIISSKKDLFKAYFDKKRFSITIWAKIIRRDLLLNITPVSIKYAEDEHMNLTLFCHTRQVVLIPYSGYFYKLNENSIMTSSTTANRVRDLIITTEYAYDCVKSLCPEIQKTAATRLNECLFADIYRTYSRKNEEERQAFRKDFLRIYRKIEENNAFIGVKGMLVKLYFKNEHLACKILRTLYKIKGEAK